MLCVFLVQFVVVFDLPNFSTLGLNKLQNGPVIWIPRELAFLDPAPKVCEAITPLFGAIEPN